MPIQAPDIENISLAQGRGSSIVPADTYARPAIPSEDKSLDQLGRAMRQLGANVTDVGAQRAELQEKQDQLQAEATYAGIRQELGTSAVSDAQLNERLADKSLIVRSRVAELLGKDAATEWITSQRDALYQGDDWKDKDVFESRLQSLKQQAAARATSNPLWGAGFIKGTDGVINGLREEALQKRTQFYTQKQEEGISQDAIQLHNGTGPRVPSFVAASTFAQKVMELSPDQMPTRPMQLAATLIGSHERRNGKVLASFIEQGTGKKIDPAVTPWCAYFVDSILSQSGNKGTGSGRALDFKTYGQDASKDPKIGDIVVFDWRDGSGHVGFFAGSDGNGNIKVLGGNQDNTVNISSFKASDVTAVRRPVSGSFSTEAAKATNGGTPADFIQKLTFSESSNNPNAKNPNSSATGLAQFTEDTWMGYMMQNRPDLVKGKSREDVLALRNDPELSKQMALKYAEDNSNVLKRNGVEVNNTTLKLAHMFDGKGAVKIMKASDGAPVEQVLSDDQIDANPFLKNMTVGQLKEWGAKQVGAPVDATTARQNALRSYDYSASRTMSVADMRRRDIYAKTFVQQAMATGDTSYLDSMPKEWVTPTIAAEFEKTRKAVADYQWQQHTRARALEAEKRQDDERKAILDIIQTEASGGTVDPRKYANTPQAYEHAMQIKDQDRLVNPVDSQAKAQKLENDLLSAYYKNDFSEVNPSWKNAKPTPNQIIDWLATQQGLKSSDKMMLLKGLDKYTKMANMGSDPVVQMNWKDTVAPVVQEMEKYFINDLNNKYGLTDMTESLTAKVKTYFDRQMLAQMKALSMREGRPPSEDEKLVIADKVTQGALSYAQMLNKARREGQSLGGVQAPGETASGQQAPAGTTPAGNPSTGSGGGTGKQETPIQNPTALGVVAKTEADGSITLVHEEPLNTAPSAYTPPVAGSLEDLSQKVMNSPGAQMVRQLFNLDDLASEPASPQVAQALPASAGAGPMNNPEEAAAQQSDGPGRKAATSKDTAMVLPLAKPADAVKMAGPKMKDIEDALKPLLKKIPGKGATSKDTAMVLPLSKLEEAVKQDGPKTAEFVEWLRNLIGTNTAEAKGK